MSQSTELSTCDDDSIYFSWWRDSLILSNSLHSDTVAPSYHRLHPTDKFLCLEVSLRKEEHLFPSTGIILCYQLAWTHISDLRRCIRPGKGVLLLSWPQSSSLLPLPSYSNHLPSCSVPSPLPFHALHKTCNSGTVAAGSALQHVVFVTARKHIMLLELGM